MAGNTLHFFTGENEYALLRELRHWKRSFSEKHGSENLLEISASTASLSDFLDAVSTMPFIAEKRLVVVRGIPKLDRAEMHALAESIHPQVIVVIADPNPDKRLGAVKELVDVAENKVFNVLSERELIRWCTDLVKQAGGDISPAASALLIATVGSDQWTLESELFKLLSFASNGEILPAHVEGIAVPSGSQVIWKLTDLIGNRRIPEALAFVRSRLDRGEDPYGLWVVLLNMVKNLVLVWSGLQEGLRDERSISSAFGMHFLAVRGLLPLAKSLSPESIRAIVHFTTESDLALKTGGYHYSADRQNELISLSERTILLCQ